MRASRELGKARRAITAVRSFYVTNAVFAGILAVLMIGLSVVLTVFFATIAVISAVGGWHIRRGPVVWSLLIACAWTLIVLVRSLMGRLVSCDFLFPLLWTIALWSAVPVARRVKALVAAHPDLGATRRLRHGLNARSAKE